jgi:hypothetical protein
VENNPVNFNDPTGLEILFQAHEVAGVTGQAHFANVIIPENQARWTERLKTMGIPFPQLVPNDSSSARYFTISGDSTGPRLWPPTITGNLTLEFNKPSDIPSTGGNFIVGPVGHPGVTEDQMIERMINATNFYNRFGRVDYDILPGALPGSGSNSTGGLFGLNAATGAVNPDLSNLGLWTAGSNDPVLRENFGVVGPAGASSGSTSILSFPSTSFSPISSSPYCKGC